MRVLCLDRKYCRIGRWWAAVYTNCPKSYQEFAKKDWLPDYALKFETGRGKGNVFLPRRRNLIGIAPFRLRIASKHWAPDFVAFLVELRQYCCSVLRLARLLRFQSTTTLFPRLTSRDSSSSAKQLASRH